MKELNQEQHIQLLQFMSLLQNCKTEEELQSLKQQYYNIPRFEFIQKYISEKNDKQSFSSYKTSLIYDMDKYQQDYKFVYGENFPSYKNKTIPNNKADYTVFHLLNEISECDDIEAYQKLLKEKNRFPKVKIEALSHDFTGIYFADSSSIEIEVTTITLPAVIIKNIPENNYNAQKQLVEAGYSPFTLPSVEDVRENGFDWLHEEISHFKETLNPNFIEQETQMNQEPEFNEQEYEEAYDDFIEQMDANGGMSAMAAEADYNASYENYEDVDEIQHQMDIDNGLTDENGNEILYDGPENEVEEHKTVKAIDIWNEIYEGISEGPEYEAKKFAVLDYLYNKGTDDMAGYKDSFERNTLRLEEISKSDEQIGQILEKYKDYNIDFDDEALAVKIAGKTQGNLTKAKQDLLDFVENKKYLKDSDISQNDSVISQEEFEKYIHSEEFISKFGDWEKASRLQKLSETPSIIKNGKVIIDGEDVTEEVNNFRNDENNKVLRIFAKEIGRSVKGTYHNDDLNIDVVLSMGNIDEIKNHHMAMSGHLEAIQYIPDIIKQGIYIAEEPNEDKTKHPNIEKYKYFVSALKIDGVDYTCKSAIGVDKEGNHYYDQRLSQIEKGLLLDNLSQLMSRGKSEQSLLNYDKRLLRICQCPQSLYLDKDLKPTREAVKLVRAGKLYLEKDENGFQLLHDIDKNKIIGKELSEMIKKNMLDTTKSKHDIQNVSDMSQDNVSTIFDTSTDSMKVNESVNAEFNNDIPVENNEVEQEFEPQNESQNYENNNTNISAPRPKNVQKLHQFFINNPYNPGTPVPKMAMINEKTGHSTFIEGYEFARLEDIGKPNPAFQDENGRQIKPDGQTVVLTKPGFNEVINKETGEKEFVPDETKRVFIKIPRDLYEQTIKNSEIIAKRNPKTEQERQKMIDDYLEAANLDEKRQRVNTADNFWHNYKAGIMTLANNKQEAMAFAKRLVNEMIPSEREKFAVMVRNYEKIKGSDGKHLSYDQKIIDFYDNMGLKITNNSIWRDHLDSKYNTLDAIKQNTEVFNKEGQPLDKTCRMKIGDTIKLAVTVDSAFSNKKIKLPIQEYRLVAHSEENNSVALISTDGKQKIIKNREDFIKEVQKLENKLLKKQQKQDRYESISM